MFLFGILGVSDAAQSAAQMVGQPLHLNFSDKLSY